jgi:imidazoleglycerol-phosphate dehydratase
VPYAIDGTNTNNYTSEEFEKMWGEESVSYTAGLELCREGKLERSTKETSILVHVLMNGLAIGDDSIQVDTGIKTMDDFVALLAKEAKMSVEAKCNGDLYVDDHHTSEDVSIALGQVLNTAFGTKAGLNRMWCATGNYGDAEVEVTMDLSNRPCITHNLSLSSNPNDEEYAGDLSIEMLDHVLESLVMNSKSTVHIVENKAGKTVLETAMATAIAYGAALRMCAAVDPRRAGKTASSKGTLSV